jgi:hypothetical protein
MVWAGSMVQVPASQPSGVCGLTVVVSVVVVIGFSCLLLVLVWRCSPWC